MKKWPGIWLALLIALTFCVACGGRSAKCKPREDDPDGTLLKICEYLVTQDIDVSPGHPAKYHILRTEVGEYQGQQAVVVYLDCCYMGDVAYLDSNTEDVIGFRIGDQ